MASVPGGLLSSKVVVSVLIAVSALVAVMSLPNKEKPVAPELNANTPKAIHQPNPKVTQMARDLEERVRQSPQVQSTLQTARTILKSPHKDESEPLKYQGWDRVHGIVRGLAGHHGSHQPGPAPSPTPAAPPPLSPYVVSNISTATCTALSSQNQIPSGGLTPDDLTTVTPEISALAAQLRTPENIFAFVRDRIEYSIRMGAGQSATQVLRSKQGSSAEKATLLVALLRAVGIPAVYASGELQITAPELQKYLGVTSLNDLNAAYGFALGRYFNSSINDTSKFTRTLNGTTIYTFPEVWVRAQVRNTWVDLDPANLNQAYQEGADARRGLRDFGSLGDWFFAPDVYGEFVKRQSFADFIFGSANAQEQQIDGTGASVVDTGAVFLGQIGGLYNFQLPTGVPGTTPCVDLVAESLPTSYRYQTSVSIKDANSGLLIRQYRGATNVTRDGTLYLSHSAGLSSILPYGTPGTVDLKFNRQTLFSFPSNTGDSFLLEYRLEGPPRFGGITMSRTRVYYSGEIFVVNQMMAPVSMPEVIEQEQKILANSFANLQEIYAELLRLTALDLLAQYSPEERHLAELRDVAVSTTHSFTTSSEFGTISYANDKPLGFYPIGGLVDWPSLFYSYPRAGNFANIYSYDNFRKMIAESIVSGSWHESSVWYELYGLKSMSTTSILQAIAEQNANGQPNAPIANYKLTAQTFDPLFDLFDPSMYSWYSTLQDFVPQEPFLYTSHADLSLPTGWRGSTIFFYPSYVFGSAASLIQVSQRPNLFFSGEEGPIASQTQPMSLANGERSIAGGSVAYPAEANSSPGDISSVQNNGGTVNNGQGPVNVAGGNDTNGTPSNNASSCPGQPVDASSGFMWHQMVDFDVAGRTANTPLRLVRTYLSFPKDNFVGAFGPNWMLNWETRLNLANRNQIIWIDESGAAWTFKSADGLNFQSPSGQFSKLTKSGSQYLLTQKDQSRMTFDGTSGRILSLRDVHGDTLTFTYNNLQQLIRVEAPFAGAATIAWSQGRATQITRTRENYVYRFAYDAQSRLASVTDFLNRQHLFQYNSSQVGTRANGLLTKIVDPIGREIQFQYYNDGRSLQQIEPEGFRLAFRYSPFQGNLKTITTLPDGTATEYLFDRLYRQIQKINPDGGTTFYSWDEQNQLRRITDELGFQTQMSFDARGNMTSRLAAGDTTPTQIQYDATFNRPVKVTPPVGSALEMALDPATGDLLSLTRKLRGNPITQQFRNDAFGNPVQMTNDLGSYSVVRDANGFLTKSFDARNPKSMSYDTRGRLVQISDVAGRTLKLGYDALDQIIQITDSDGPTIQFTRDTMERIVAKTVTSGAVSQVTKYTWDGRDRLTSVTDPLGKVTTYVYEKFFLSCHQTDQPTQIIDPNGRVTRFDYDAQNRLVRKIEGNGSVYQMNYNQRGDMVGLVDPNGQLWQFRYDGKGQLIREIRPTAYTDGNTAKAGQSVLSYVYDPAGRLTEKSQGRNVAGAVLTTTGYAYDDLDRLITRFEGKSQNGQIIKTDDIAHFDYENLLSPVIMKSAKNNWAINSWTHERLPPYAQVAFSVAPASPQAPVLAGQWSVAPAVNSEFGTIRDEARGLAWNFGYTPAGRMSLGRVTKPGANPKDRDCDRDGFSNSRDLVMNLKYDGFARLSQLQSNTGVVQTRSYDVGNRLTAIGGTYRENLSYNPSDEISKIISSFASEEFSYNNRGELIGVQDITNPRKVTSTQYQYDPNGNRLSLNESGQVTNSQYVLNQIITSGSQTYLPDSEGLGQITSVQDSKVQEKFEYAVNGRVAQYERTTCKSPTKCSTQKTLYKYDALGRRLSKQINSDKGSQVHTFAYLGKEDQILEASNGSEITAYLDRLGQGSRLGEHLGEASKREVRAYVKDHLDSVLNPAGTEGLVKYGEFGRSALEKETDQKQSPPVVYGFTGGEFDRESGKYYFRYRAYDPMTGRWTSNDPIGFEGDGANLYLYVLNRPIDRVDSDGQYSLPVVILVTGTLAAVAAKYIYEFLRSEPVVYSPTQNYLRSLIAPELRQMLNIPDPVENYSSGQSTQTTKRSPANSQNDLCFTCPCPSR